MTKKYYFLKCFAELSHDVWCSVWVTQDAILQRIRNHSINEFFNPSPTLSHHNRVEHSKCSTSECAFEIALDKLAQGIKLFGSQSLTWSFSLWGEWAGVSESVSQWVSESMNVPPLSSLRSIVIRNEEHLFVYDPGSIVKALVVSRSHFLRLLNTTGGGL